MITPKTSTPADEPDFTALTELVNEYVAEVESGTAHPDRLSKYDSYIMEAAIEAVHGKDIWDRLNPILAEM